MNWGYRPKVSTEWGILSLCEINITTDLGLYNTSWVARRLPGPSQQPSTSPCSPSSRPSPPPPTPVPHTRLPAPPPPPHSSPTPVSLPPPPPPTLVPHIRPLLCPSSHRSTPTILTLPRPVPGRSWPTCKVSALYLENCANALRQTETETILFIDIYSLWDISSQEETYCHFISSLG